MLRRLSENLHPFFVIRTIERFKKIMGAMSKRSTLSGSGQVIRYFCCLAAALSIIFFSNYASAAVSTVPLVLSSSAKANTLVILDNSNSMDEAPSGSAVGSFSAESKSEIARGIIRQLLTDYQDKINLGLMSYKLATTSNNQIHNSPYDVSYNSDNYKPDFTGNRSSTTKKYKVTVTNGTYTTDVYYNVALPFYAGSNQGTQFCYSYTADANNTTYYPDGFHTTETISGPWDDYYCYKYKKTKSDDPAPKDKSNGNGYDTWSFNSSLHPTDSDYAQGLFDFGKRLMWYNVGATYFANTSPGRGYLNTPIKLLNSTQVTTLTNVLKCNVPGAGAAPYAACATTGIKNAGLTPIEGTLLTAKDYFSGSWSTTSEGYTASVYPLPESCGKNYAILLTDGLPSTNKSGTILTNPTTAITEAAAAAATLKTAGVETYVVGFALPYGTDPNTLNTIAASGGTETAYLATDQATLTAALNTIFADIQNKSSSTTALATNSTRLETNTAIYQAKFNSTDWSGQLLAYKLAANGTIEEDALWDTDSAGTFPAHGSRTIYTWNGTQGISFTVGAWSSLDSGQQTALISGGTTTDGQNRLNWIRGDQSKEKKNGGAFRNRNKLLGDIVNSNPLYVDSTKSQYVGTTETVYVGANDGMLHAFDAATGVEKFAFVPKAVFSKFANLTNPSYVHQFFVDGSPQVGDVDGKAILLGATGAGGRSVFALDVSNPNSFDASKVLWEYTDADLGYTIGQPSIGRLQNGTQVAIFGNGYESDNKKAFLYVVNINTGVLIAKIATGAGSTATPNGLAAPTLLIDPDDSNKSVVAAYAGDLLGNMWKFDLTGSLSNATSPAFGGSPLFKARDSFGVVQPITAAPTIGRHPSGGYLIFFGTGKYFEVGDHSANASPVQSLYGIWDTATLVSGAWQGGSAITVTDRSVLQQQTIIGESTAAGNHWRVVSKNSIAWGAKRGWYLDLPTAGERITDSPVLKLGRVVFTTRIPSNSTDPCVPSGTSWLIAVDMLTGGRTDAAIFDVNRDSSFDQFDTVLINGERVIVSGFETAAAGMSRTTLLQFSPGLIDILQSGTESLTTTADATSNSDKADVQAVAAMMRAARDAAAAVIADAAAQGDAAVATAIAANGSAAQAALAAAKKAAADSQPTADDALISTLTTLLSSKDVLTALSGENDPSISLLGKNNRGTRMLGSTLPLKTWQQLR